MPRSTSHPEWRKAIPNIEKGVRVGQVPQLNLTERSLAKNGFDKKSIIIRNGARPFPTLRRALAREKIEGFRSTSHPEWRKAIPYIKILNKRKTALEIQSGFEY